MRKRIYKILNCILIVSLTITVTLPHARQALRVQATSITEIQNQIDETQNTIETINERIETLTDEQDIIQEMIDDLNAEIINTMTSIGMKEDEIAAKEAQLAETEAELEETQEAYEEAKAREEKQHEDMLTRIRYMYENGTSTYLNLLLQGGGLAEMLNRMDYIEKIYEYDRAKLAEFEETKRQVQELWDLLNVQKTIQETERQTLQADKELLETQKSELDIMLVKKQEESANFEAEIKHAKQEAAVAKKLLQQEQQQLALLQQQNQGNNSNAANQTYTSTGYTEIIDSADGSDLGKKIAKYACQYIGNPYVAGGTSLTKGADCSGFTFRVYSDFNYRLPRTSFEQRSAGVGVDYANAQPGDLICYSGHVGLYIGGGKIVHASSARTGIKVSNANYRTILAVRRIISE